MWEGLGRGFRRGRRRRSRWLPGGRGPRGAERVSGFVMTEGGWVSGERTFAPAATAFRTRVWHWARLWVMLAVEHSWPIAWGNALGLWRCLR